MFQGFECRLCIPMEKFISHVPPEHKEARLQRSLPTLLAPLPHEWNKQGSYSLIDSKKWISTVLWHLAKSCKSLPCKDFIRFRGGKVQAPAAIFSRTNSKFWTARAYCKEITRRCFQFNFTLYDFDLNDESVEILVQSVEGSTLLSGNNRIHIYIIILIKLTRFNTLFFSFDVIGPESLEWHVTTRP